MKSYKAALSDEGGFYTFQDSRRIDKVTPNTRKAAQEKVLTIRVFLWLNMFLCIYQ